ncbi:GMC oxidoreductase [Sorangium sp. So ce118]
MLLFLHGLDFVAAFYGCMYAGAVAAAVDGRGRVRGVEGLLVADASIMRSSASRLTGDPSFTSPARAP